ncbi:MAG: hypothetical protein ACLQG3_00730 [Terracidiphilus sp.]
MQADPADRIIVATARHLGATLVTAGQALLELSKKGHFRTPDAADWFRAQKETHPAASHRMRFN